MTGSPSSVPLGQKEARKLEMMSEMATAASRGFPGFTVQKKPSWVRHENSVRNSETDTLRKIEVMTFPYSMGGSPSPANMPFGLFESSPAAKSSSDEPLLRELEVRQSVAWVDAWCRKHSRNEGGGGTRGRGDANGFCVACAYIIYTHRGIRYP
jgi:hypothetical protein